MAPKAKAETPVKTKAVSTRKASSKEVAIQQPESEQQAFMRMISEIAVNPAVDVEKMRAVMDMKVELFNRNAEIEFNQAMALVQADIKTVFKSHINTQTDSKYAKLADIIRVCSPVWTGYGFSLSFGSKSPSQQGFYCITCVVAHKAGHSRVEVIELPADNCGIGGRVNKTGVHAFGSTVEYGRRYLTCMIFNIPVGEDDDGNAAGQAEAQAHQQQQEQVQYYPELEFKKNLPAWKTALAERRVRADVLIAKCNSKFPLTEKQKTTILAFAPTEENSSENT